MHDKQCFSYGTSSCLKRRVVLFSLPYTVKLLIPYTLYTGRYLTQEGNFSRSNLTLLIVFIGNYMIVWRLLLYYFLHPTEIGHCVGVKDYFPTTPSFWIRKKNNFTLLHKVHWHFLRNIWEITLGGIRCCNFAWMLNFQIKQSSSICIFVFCTPYTTRCLLLILDVLWPLPNNSFPIKNAKQTIFRTVYGTIIFCNITQRAIVRF